MRPMRTPDATERSYVQRQREAVDLRLQWHREIQKRAPLVAASGIER